MAWRTRLETLNAFLDQCPDFEAAGNWISEHPEMLADGYGFSKQCIIVYTMRKAAELAGRNIRINCISPSPTASAFMETLKGEGRIPDEAIELFLPPNGRYASGDDMAMPLIALNSTLAGFVSGVNLPVDFGFCAQVLTGQRDDLLGIAQ
jgi:NAD(P)-dependent dehydrogenase (short-subunit alcohol dehydrogenase family)